MSLSPKLLLPNRSPDSSVTSLKTHTSSLQIQTYPLDDLSRFLLDELSLYTDQQIHQIYPEEQSLPSFALVRGAIGCSCGSVVRALRLQHKGCGFDSQGTHILTKNV